MYKIGVILVNYNGKEYNDKCIKSILNSTISEQIQIIIVDNASTDGSLEELREQWVNNAQIHIIPLKENYGFSKANNEGIRWAIKQGIEFFLLLNNDTEIEPYTIECMVDSQKQRNAIVVPQVLYADRPDIIWYAGGDFSPIINKQRNSGINRHDNAKYKRSRYCSFANGCCLLLTKKIIKRMGLLDERFFLYGEDTEYSLRAKERGIDIWYCADAVVYHKVNGSSLGNEKPDNAYYITRNWLLCNCLHRNDCCCRKGWYALFLLYFVCNRAAWASIWLIQRKPQFVLAIWRGIHDFCKGKFGKTEYWVL